MPELTTTAINLAAGALAVQTITVAGVHLGLRPDLLVGGFSGAVVAIVLLNTVPSVGDTWRHMVRTTARRMSVACASSLTAGYLTPPFGPLLTAVLGADGGVMTGAFVVGAGAQWALAGVVARMRAALRKGAEGAQ